jgi:diguanylate cyclase (GGDEF)-like protein
MPQKTRLDDLLEQDGPIIIETWACMLHSLGNTPYASLPLDELRANCTACFRAYQALIQHNDQWPLRVFIARIAPLRASQDFGITQVQRAFLIAKQLVRPRLLARYAGSTDMAALLADWRRFEQAVDVAVVRFTEDYHARVTADLERQRARWGQLSNQLVEMVTHDELTGLHNYRFFQERIIDEVRRSVRYHRPLSLFMADIDHFKRVNDTFGHQTGNTVLHHVATLIHNKVRNTDIVTRYGGEEFAVLLPETDAGDALIVAEHVRATVAASRPPRLPHVTVSLGVSTHQRGDLDGARMLGEADHALYQAKHAGRNRVVFFR